MPAPEISAHRGRRQQVADQDGRPGQGAKHRRGGHHASRHEAELEDDEEEQDSEADVGPPLRHGQEPCGNSSDDAEDEPVYPRVEANPAPQFKRNFWRQRISRGGLSWRPFAV